jgi:hypothetical protein
MVDFIAVLSRGAGARSGSQDFVPADENAAHRKFAACQSLRSLVQSDPHIVLIIHKFR